MIEKLIVKNIAVVESAEITFGSGLNVVTGETGAGKSVLIGALKLLSGSRADHSLIRHGAQHATVMAEWLLPRDVADGLTPLLEAIGVDACEENRLIIRRTIAVSGSGRCLVNNCPSTVQALRRVGERLIDLHGPHDNQSLLEPDFQLDALDAFGHCYALRNTFAEIWRERRHLQQRRETLSGDSESVARELDLLQHQIQEIADAELSIEADGEALVAEHTESANAGYLLELGSGALQLFSEGDGAAIDVIASAIRILGDMQRNGAVEAEQWLEEAQSISIQLNELSQAVASNLSRIDASPERMQWLDDRMTLVEKLKRKYGRSVEAVLEFYETAQTRAADLASRSEQVAGVDREIAAVEKRLEAAGSALRKVRAEASGTLAAAVSKQLADLGLPHAAFRVDLTAADADRETGRDVVEFGFEPNPGERMRPLRSIASSGEISRVMLALKTVLAEHDKVPVLVFDEIDANIGGEIANIVGSKLADVARLHQVVCITHLPQVAAWGRQHFAVTKQVEDGRTHTRIQLVSDAERIEELTRMLGGADLTSVTLDHARELLTKLSVRQGAQD